MTPEEEAAAVLGGVIEVGPTPHTEAMRASWEQQLAERPARIIPPADPAVLDTLRQLAEPPTFTEVPTSPLLVTVDFNDLVEAVGQTEAFDLIGKLKDLLG